MSILDWVKANAKDGANIAEAEELIAKENPLTAVTNSDQAAAFIMDTPNFRSAYDSMHRKGIESHDAKFAEGKLPGLLKAEADKVRAELNPKETDEQKRIRELEDKLKTSEDRAAKDILKKELSSKAQSLGIPDGLAEVFAVHGDSAMERLQSFSDTYTSAVTAKVDAAIKDRFKGQPTPNRGKETPADKRMARAEFDAMTPVAQGEFVSKGGIPYDE